MEKDGILYLTGEDGGDIGFAVLDLISWDGYDFAVLEPLSEEDDGLVILNYETLEDGTREFYEIEDRETVDAVYGIFRENRK